MKNLRCFVSSKFNQDILWNLGSIGILAISGIAINIIIITLRGPNALGIFNQIYAIYIVISQISVLGLQHSTLKHISYNFEDRQLCTDYVISALTLVTLTNIPIIIIGLLTADKVGIWLQSPSVSQGLKFVVPGLLFFSLNKVLLRTVNGFRLMRAYAVFTTLRFIFIPVLILLIITLKYTDAYIVLSLPITELLLFAIVAFYTFTRIIPIRNFSNIYPLFKQHLTFGVQSSLSTVLAQLNTRVDIIMLGYFLSDDMVGIYSFAAMIVEGFGELAYAVRWNVDPLIGRYFSSGEKNKIGQLSRQIRRVTLRGMIFIGGLAILFYPIVLRHIISPEIAYRSWPLFIIMMTGVTINAGYRPFSGILLQGGKPAFHTLLILILVVNDASLNLIFIPLLGYYGSAFVTMTTYILEVVALRIFVWKIFEIHL